MESIRRIDLSTQRSIARVESATLPTLASHTAAAQERARELRDAITVGGEGAEAIAQELELLSGGERSRFPGYFEPLLNHATAFDYLAPASLVVVDEREEGAEALAQHVRHQEEARAALERRGEIPAGLPDLGLEPGGVERLLNAHETRVELGRFGAEALGAVRLPFAAAPAFGGRIREVVRQAEAWAEEGRAVVLASQQALRLADLMEEEGLTPQLTRSLTEVPEAGGITIVPATASGGFLLGETFALISDEEVFGLRRTRRPQRPRRGITPNILTTLQPGDSVVHIDHGIARFAGLTRRMTDAVEREYLELEYAEGDRLFVPTDQLGSVSAYVGAERPATVAHAAGFAGVGQHEASRAARGRGDRAGVARPVRAAGGGSGGRLSGGRSVADRDGRGLPLRGDARPDAGDHRREGGHGVDEADGPADRGGCRLREDGGGGAGGLQGRDGGAAGGRARPDDGARRAARSDLPRAHERVPGGDGDPLALPLLPRAAGHRRRHRRGGHRHRHRGRTACCSGTWSSRISVWW